MNKASLLTFPCQFPIKVIGKNNEQLKNIVLDIIRQHAPDIMEGALKTNKSKGKNYISLTIEITAESKVQLDAIYQALNDCESVVMTL